MKRYYVYVLKSEKNGYYYKGFTDDLEKRLKEHNSGYVKSTKPNRPWNLVYFEQYETVESARDREKWLKSGQGRDFLRDQNL